jgi:hypothetical protein
MGGTGRGGYPYTGVGGIGRPADTEVDAVVDLGPRPGDESPPGHTVPGPGTATHSV